MGHPTPHARIIVDEVGVATARLGGFLLKTRFDPIFARDGGCFHPVAAEAATAVFVDGVPVSRTQMPVHRGDALDTEIAIHLRNRWNIGTAEIDCVVIFASPLTLIHGRVSSGAGQDHWLNAITAHGTPLRWSPLVAHDPAVPPGGLGLRCGVDLDRLRLNAFGRPVRVERPTMVSIDVAAVRGCGRPSRSRRSPGLDGPGRHPLGGDRDRYDGYARYRARGRFHPLSGCRLRCARRLRRRLARHRAPAARCASGSRRVPRG